jgi:hypothetical protein
MNRNFIVILCLSAAIFVGCKTETATKTNSNAVDTKTPSTDAKKDMPKTEKVESEEGFMSSESGTEKSKPAAGKANLQGKVLFNEKPVPNVEVKICEKFSNYIGGCSGGIFKSKTDENGEYLIANVPPNTYEALLVQVFNSKDYIFTTIGYGISAAKYKLEADKTFFAPETNLFKNDLKVQNPKAKAKIDLKDLEIKWDAYPDAAYYRLSVNPDKYEAGATSISSQKIEGATSYKPEKPLKNGLYRLSLSAYNANDVKLSDSSDDFEFTVTGGESSGNSSNSEAK